MEAATEPLCINSHAENWFSMQILSSIVDKCYLDVPDMTVQRSVPQKFNKYWVAYVEFRKELHYISSALPKNRNRVSKNICSVIGSHFHEVIKTIGGKNYEFSGMEVVRKWEGISSLKSLVNTWKLKKITS